MKNDEVIPEQNTSVSNAPLMWMHLLWWTTGFIPLIPFIIWRGTRERNPQVRRHMRNILNASLTYILFHALSLFSFIGILVALISFGLIEGTVWWMPLGVSAHTPNPIPGILFLAIYMSVLVYVIVSSVITGIAARKGEFLPYRWAIRFFKI